MGNEYAGFSAHSAEYFGDTRDYWYTPDFLRLMAERLRLGEVREALDVGCGVGHWGRLVGRLLPEAARVTGVDREPVWVEEALARARALSLEERLRYQQGLVEALPFADDSFDMVTCQTVLIHVRDPRAAIAEMIRVTRPGGLVVAAEPNNVASCLMSETMLKAPVDEVLRRVRFQLMCERGKEALGEGNNSVGEALPGLFASLGLEDVQVFMNDKASPLLPPYRGAEARALVEERLAFAARDFWLWSQAETKRYFIAGGGDEDDFEICWAAARTQGQREIEEIARGSYSFAGGGVMYLIAGRKRA